MTDRGSEEAAAWQACLTAVSRTRASMALILSVTAETAPHGGQDLSGKRSQPARLEALHQRGGYDWYGNALVDGGEYRPAALA